MRRWVPVDNVSVSAQAAGAGSRTRQSCSWCCSGSVKPVRKQEWFDPIGCHVKGKQKIRKCPVCGKDMYMSFAAAVAAVNGRILHDAPPLRIYEEHGAFHLTSKPRYNSPHS